MGPGAHGTSVAYRGEQREMGDFCEGPMYNEALRGQVTQVTFRHIQEQGKSDTRDRLVRKVLRISTSMKENNKKTAQIPLN